MSFVKQSKPKSRKISRRGGHGSPPVDLQRVARAMSGPGIDTRVWKVSGTVGVVTDDGEFDTTDPEAVYVDALGAVVSVRVEPSGELLTARWNGISCGRFGFVLFPIKPGAEVSVDVPAGDFNHPGITITGLASNSTAQIPTDWNNDGFLFSLNCPFEVRAPAIRMSSSNLVLNGRNVTRSPEDI